MQRRVELGVAGQRQERVALAVGVGQWARKLVCLRKLVAQSLRSLAAPHGHGGKQVEVDEPLQTSRSAGGAPIVGHCGLSGGRYSGVGVALAL